MEILIAVVIGLTQLVKKLEVINKKFLPIVAMIVALGFGAISLYFPELLSGIVKYAIVGLTASGLYGATKDVIKK